MDQNNNFEMNPQDAPVVENTPAEETAVVEEAPIVEEVPVVESAPSQDGVPTMDYTYVPTTESVPVIGGGSAQGDNSKDGICMAAFVLGIVGFVFNPFSVITILAIVFGAIGQGSESQNAGKAKIGMFLGIGAFALQFLVDLFIMLITGGAGFFSCCC